MKNFNHFLLIIFANLIFLSSAQSETYYVSAVGSNSNTPLQAKNIASPWLTVQFAIDNPVVVNGDNIVVAAGTYGGFTLTKRINIIGAWKGGTAAVNTIFNSTVNLSAAGGSPEERMFLKNLRISATSGDAISMNKGFVTLENVFATTTGVNGVRINDFLIKDVRIEACNLNNNAYAGIFIPTFVDIDGLIIRNTTISNNGYFGIVAFQTKIDPSEIKNVVISHCALVDNNPTNQIQGHTIYFEKLKNAIFENISVVMPPGNDWIGIDINLVSRTDYSNITIQNSRIIRATPGSGIWIQARNDLLFPPAALDTVTLRGLTFTNCDTNIAFNRQVKRMTVDKCDLSTYSVYGLVNYTDQDGIINASNNKWQGGGVPDTTVISGGLLVTGSPIISFMPSTDGIFVGMCIKGPGIKPGATVVGKSPNTIIMSDTALASGFIPQIGFNFGCVLSTDIVRTSLNFVQCGNPLPNAIINQANVSFPTLNAAIAGTASGGTIYNVPKDTIPGVTIIPRPLKLIGPGAGFLHAGSQTTFEVLSVQTDNFLMGSDFATMTSFIADGTGSSGTTYIGLDNTLSLNGAINSEMTIVGGDRSDIFVGGPGTPSFLPTVVGGLRTLQLNRPNGIGLSDSLRLHRLLFLQNGVLEIYNNNLTLDPNTTIFNPLAASYVKTNGLGEVRKNFVSTTPTAFEFKVGAGSGAGNPSPVQIYFSSWTLAPGNYVSVRVDSTKHPQNQCSTDYLNRFWVIRQNGISSFNADLKFSYSPSNVFGTEANIYGAEWDGFGWTVFTPVNTTTHTFTTNGITSFGDFTGGGASCIGDFATVINTRLFLQGAYIGGSTMRTDLRDEGIIPLTQPYSGSQFNYNGTESVASIPAGVVDWVYLETRATSGGIAIPSGRRAAFIKSDGSIVDLDGVSKVKVNIITGNYFIVVGHRNHLPVMSSASQTLNTASTLYDFTTGIDKYFGNQAASLDIGVFGAFSGDANGSFIISASDYTRVTANLGATNYNMADLNLSSIVSASDYNFVTINLGRVSQVPNY